MITSEMLRCRAAAHEAIAAQARAEALMLDVLPVGRMVRVLGLWSGKVEALSLPFDGTLVVRPVGELPKYTRTIGGSGSLAACVSVHVDQMQLEESGK